MIFHISNVSIHTSGISTIAKRLIDNLSGRDIPAFRVDHFGNFTDGIFVVIAEHENPSNTQKCHTEVEDAIASVKNEFRLDCFSGHWID